MESTQKASDPSHPARAPRTAVVAARVPESVATELQRLADEHASTVSRLVARAIDRDLRGVAA